MAWRCVDRRARSNNITVILSSGHQVHLQKPCTLRESPEGKLKPCRTTSSAQTHRSCVLSESNPSQVSTCLLKSKPSHRPEPSADQSLGSGTRILPTPSREVSGCGVLPALQAGCLPSNFGLLISCPALQGTAWKLGACRCGPKKADEEEDDDDGIAASV